MMVSRPIFRIPALALLTLLSGCALPRPVDATVVQSMDLEAQSVGADRIFVGTVRGVEVREADGRVETVATLEVEEVVAGSVPSTIELRFAGGEIGGVKRWIDGMPELAAGERYVVFLEAEHDPPYMSPIFGFNQGLYRVVPDAARAGGLVVRDRLGRPLDAATGAGALAARDAGGGEPTLGAFVGAIRAARGR
jgi:hypothetical protein